MNHLLNTVAALMILWGREHYKLTQAETLEDEGNEEEEEDTVTPEEEEPTVTHIVEETEEPTIEELIAKVEASRPWGVLWYGKKIPDLTTGHLCSLVEAYRRGAYLTNTRAFLPSSYQASAVMAELKVRLARGERCPGKFGPCRLAHLAKAA